MRIILPGLRHACVAGQRSLTPARPPLLHRTLTATQIIKLKTNMHIPDDGELNWPLFVADTATVSDVRLELHGLYHTDASDLVIKLHHDGLSHTIADGGSGTMDLGEPDPYEHPNVAGPAYPDPTGLGYEYGWEDAMGDNLALGKSATQSSDSFGGVASRAVDGQVNGYYSAESTTHTGGDPTRWPVQLDAEPWWEVDLNSTFSDYNDTADATKVGTVRLWNRQQEPNLDEVQVVTTTSAGTIAGTFTLSLTHQGATTTTGAISHNAVAMVRDETAGTTTAGTGVGESVQAKLQALSNVNQVVVRRSGQDANSAYSWTITFVSEPGDVTQMTATNLLTSAATNVVVTTVREGNSNIYYNYKGNVVRITGTMLPGWLMLFDRNTTVGDVSLAAAKAASVWRRRIDTDQREHTFVMPANRTARFVRVQLETKTDALSIAEVQVFRKRASTVSNYAGGSPLRATTYQPNFSLKEAFNGSSLAGEWTLSIEDTTAAGVSHTVTSVAEALAHGKGALDSWTLVATLSTGEVRRYQPDVMAVIKTLPVYGTLYEYNASTGGRGNQLAYVDGQGKYLTECYGTDNCYSSFGVGCPFSTSGDGSIATPTNRLTPVTHDRSVVYAPNADWLGSDHFTYTVLLGVQESAARGTVTVDTMKCRVRTDCANEFTGDYSILRR